MTIAKAIAEKFGSGGKTIAQTIRNITDIPGGGSSSDPNPGQYKSLEKLEDYLYEATYEELDDVFADEWFRTHDSGTTGGCSVVSVGPCVARNFDWFYNHMAEFVVHVPKSGDKHGYTGVAGGISELTEQFVASGEASELYKLIPYMMLDGINDKGVFAEINVVPAEGNVIEPEGYSAEVCSTALVQYVLRNFSTATEAVEYIREHVKVYFPEKLTAMGYETHYMIRDKEKCYILEFDNDEVVIVEPDADKAILTNFKVYGVEFGEDPLIYTPATNTEEANAELTNHIQPLGSGLERYLNVYQLVGPVHEELNTISSSDLSEMLATAVKYSWYTLAYTATEDKFYSEFVGYEGLTCGSADLDKWEAVTAAAAELYAERSRDTGKTWQTVHTTVYDYAESRMIIIPQETYAQTHIINLETELNPGMSVMFTAKEADLTIESGASGMAACNVPFRMLGEALANNVPVNMCLKYIASNGAETIYPLILNMMAGENTYQFLFGDYAFTGIGIFIQLNTRQGSCYFQKMDMPGGGIVYRDVTIVIQRSDTPGQEDKLSTQVPISAFTQITQGGYGVNATLRMGMTYYPCKKWEYHYDNVMSESGRYVLFTFETDDGDKVVILDDEGVRFQTTSEE